MGKTTYKAGDKVKIKTFAKLSKEFKPDCNGVITIGACQFGKLGRPFLGNTYILSHFLRKDGQILWKARGSLVAFPEELIENVCSEGVTKQNIIETLKETAKQLKHNPRPFKEILKTNTTVDVISIFKDSVILRINRNRKSHKLCLGEGDTITIHQR